MPHFALLKVHLSAKGAALGPAPGRSLRCPAARHLCTGQILAAAVTMKGPVEEASLGGDREVRTEGREAASEEVGVIVAFKPSLTSQLSWSCPRGCGVLPDWPVGPVT